MKIKTFERFRDTLFSDELIIALLFTENHLTGCIATKIKAKSKAIGIRRCTYRKALE